MPMTDLPLPPALQAGDALFLDFDGTLADIAPRPDAVRVADGLANTLLRLHERLGGALAIVSGRPIEELDRQLAPLRLPAAGVHGMERRDAQGLQHRLVAGGEPALERVADAAEALAARHRGLLVERKPGAVALHFRLAPELEALCIETMRAAVAGDAALALLHGKAVIEAKPTLAGKGRAIAAFMTEAPFAGRRPVFAGDDVTDEAGFEVALALGGDAVKVGDGATAASFRLADPSAVQVWLEGALAAARAA
jgi:trehalose 6-phosphate phosphatase